MALLWDLLHCLLYDGSYNATHPEKDQDLYGGLLQPAHGHWTLHPGKPLLPPWSASAFEMASTPLLQPPSPPPRALSSSQFVISQLVCDTWDYLSAAIATATDLSSASPGKEWDLYGHNQWHMSAFTWSERASERTNGAQTCASKGTMAAAETLELWPPSFSLSSFLPDQPLGQAFISQKPGWDKLKKKWKCPPGTCSANALDVKFGNTSLHWKCFKCITIREVKIWMIFEYPWCPNIYDVWNSMMSEYPWCPNIYDIRISMMS